MIRRYGINNLGPEGIDLYIRMRHQGLNPNNFTNPFLLKACSGLNQGRGVHSLVVKDKRFSSEIHSLTSLITLYCAFGDVESARLLFDRMNERNVVTWTWIITRYVKQKRYKEGIELFNQMKISGVGIDELTLVSVLSACANLGALEIGQWVHKYVDKKGIFFNPKLDVCVWNAVIGGLAMHGYGIEAIERFREMQLAGIKPDRNTFIAVLSACSHSGLVEKGKEILHSSIEPHIKHYACFVDILCRAGLLSEAYEVITNMPMEPNAVLWGTLCLCCCWQCRASRGCDATADGSGTIQ
ncbi:60S ribosomal protein L7a-like [Hibiscus syriacus]|uniref:60S ribosomal protein L7a-like n=1 Tax=Hibiscus syriacus TaxID=106335 RepID=A0A6A2X6I7_HIBSY|nr:60S ribosomal protein L7a-like [Hibiscus syriacus]